MIVRVMVPNMQHAETLCPTLCPENHASVLFVLEALVVSGWHKDSETKARSLKIGPWLQNDEGNCCASNVEIRTT